MTPKTRKVFMALVGAYLVYTGGSLIADVLRSNPKNMVMFVVVGAFFAVFGLATIVWNVKGFIDESKKEQAEAIQEGKESEEGNTVTSSEEEQDEVSLDEDARPVDQEGDE